MAIADVAEAAVIAFPDEKWQERPMACEQFHRLERGHGSFQRSFQLPLPIDHGAVTADLKDGVLTVRCPKLPEPSARRIPITP